MLMRLRNSRRRLVKRSTRRFHVKNLKANKVLSFRCLHCIMSSDKSVKVNCLCIKIKKATFARPRPYFLTTQCIHKDSNIEDIKTKFRTAVSESTKTPEFEQKKPFQIKLSPDITVAEALDQSKVVFEAYAIVPIDGVPTNKGPRCLGESVVNLSEKKEALMKHETIDEVILLQGVLKTEQGEKRVNVGQAAISMALQQLELSESVLDQSQSQTSLPSKPPIEGDEKETALDPKEGESVTVGDNNETHNSSSHKSQPLSTSNAQKSKSKSKSKSLTPSLHTYTVRTPPLVQWPAIKHGISFDDSLCTFYLIQDFMCIDFTFYDQQTRL